MSEHQKYVLHLENKVKQLEYLLDQERKVNFLMVGMTSSFNQEKMENI